MDKLIAEIMSIPKDKWRVYPFKIEFGIIILRRGEQSITVEVGADSFLIADTLYPEFLEYYVVVKDEDFARKIKRMTNNVITNKTLAKGLHS